MNTDNNMNTKNENLQNTNKELKHKPTYIVKRRRLYSYLTEKGFEPEQLIPDIQNPKFVNWVYKNTPELEQALNEYFDKLKQLQAALEQLSVTDSAK